MCVKETQRKIKREREMHISHWNEMDSLKMNEKLHSPALIVMNKLEILQSVKKNDDKRNIMNNSETA